MRKTLYTQTTQLLRLALFGCLLVAFNHTKAQSTYPPDGLLWGASPFQDSMWSVRVTDPAWPIIDRVAPSLAGFTITGITGMATDPCTFEHYVIMKLSGVSGRVLGTIDLKTGVCTQIGNLGNNFSSLAFRKDGQLFGLTGNGANPNPESLFTIDKATAATTLVVALGNGADGETMCYNPDDDMFYHFSGNGTVVFEKVMAQSPYTVTPIAPSLGSGEVFGTLYAGNNLILLSTISSNFRYTNTAGALSTAFGTNPDDLRGLVMPPAFAIQDDTVCLNELITLGGIGQHMHKTYIYWGDGTVDSLNRTDTFYLRTTTTHQYSTNGNFTVNVLMGNGVCSPDTVWSHTVRVNALPQVAISGLTGLCPSGSVLLTGSTGGSSQWYLNGGLINGANGNNYTATVSGSYNMIKTNQNGCSDSAATPFVLVDVTNPVVNLGADVTQCGGTVTIDAANVGATYLWSDNSTGQTLAATTNGNYAVTVTDAFTCTGTDDINVTILTVPTVNLGADVTQCGGSTTLDAGNAGASYLWSDNSTAQTLAVSTNGNFAVTVTDPNTCTASDDINVTINTNPTVNLGADVTQCGGSATLDAGNAGATYAWSDNSSSQTLTATITGTYAVTVTDANNCTATDDVDVTINTNPTVNLGADVTQCGGSATLDAGNAGATYLWSDNSTAQTLAVSTNGNFAVTVTDANNCTGTDDVNVTINTAPTVDLGADITQCGGSTTLDAGNAGATYAWSDNSSSQTLTVTTGGTYAVTVTDANNCSAIDDVDVTINTAPTVDLGADVTQCGGSATLDAGNAGATYAWSDNSTAQTLTVTAGGTYAVTVTDANNCTATDDVDVTINTNPTVTATTPDDTLCQIDNAITLTGTPAGGTFSGTGVTGATFTPSAQLAGVNTITYTYTDNNNCTGTATVDVVVEICSGIETALATGTISLLPNPANRVAYLNMQLTETATVTLFDLTGKAVMQQTYAPGNNLPINVQAIPAGLYVVKVTGQHTNGTARLQVIH